MSTRRETETVDEERSEQHRRGKSTHDGEEHEEVIRPVTEWSDDTAAPLQRGRSPTHAEHWMVRGDLHSLAHRIIAELGAVGVEIERLRRRGEEERTHQHESTDDRDHPSTCQTRQ